MTLTSDLISRINIESAAYFLYSICPLVREKSGKFVFFFKVREKSGNSVKWSGKFENLKVREKSGNFKVIFIQTPQNIKKRKKNR